jgi:PAS domain S-box-containing protein
MTHASHQEFPVVLGLDNEIARLIRGADWARTPLGPIDAWPHALRAAINLILNSRHPMFVFWGATLACFYNDAYRPSIGPERHPNAIGRPASEVWAEIWDTIGPQIDLVMSGRGATWHENQFVPITRRGRRESVYWTYSYSPILDESFATRVGGVLVVCTETTHEVLSRARETESSALHKAERDWLAELLDQAPSFIALLSGPQHRVELANRAYLSLIGDRPVIGRTIADALPKAVTQGYLSILDQVYRSGEAFRSKGAKFVVEAHAGEPQDERFLDFVYQPVRDASGAVTGIFVEGSDVTERALAERELGRTAALLRTIIEATPSVIYVKDRESRMRIANSAALALIGKPWSEVAGRTDREFLADQEQAESVMANDRKVIATGETQELEEWVGSGRGPPRLFLSTKSPLRDDDGAVIGLVGVSVDITARKQAEASRQLLIDELNHRIKNMLTVVQAIAHQTFRRGEIPDSSRKAFEGRIAALAAAHDVLQRSAWDNALLSDVISEAVAFCGPAQQRISHSGPALRLDQKQALAVTLAVHELCTNAMKYGALSNDDGAIEMSWRVEGAEPWLEIVWRERGGPPVLPPKKRSFGSILIERALAQELGGASTLSFDPEGLTCVVRAPLRGEP